MRWVKAQNNWFLEVKVLFWTPHFSVLDSTFWLDSTLKIDPAVSNGFVFKGNRVVIPTGARDDILQRLHASHIGINWCLRRTRETVFYPGITTALKDLVSKCAVCLRFQQETQKEKPLLPHEAPERPWQKVGTDIFTHRGQDYLITVCYLTGYFEVDRIPSKRNLWRHICITSAIRSLWTRPTGSWGVWQQPIQSCRISAIREEMGFFACNNQREIQSK